MLRIVRAVLTKPRAPRIPPDPDLHELLEATGRPTTPGALVEEIQRFQALPVPASTRYLKPLAALLEGRLEHLDLPTPHGSGVYVFVDYGQLPEDPTLLYDGRADHLFVANLAKARHRAWNS